MMKTAVPFLTLFFICCGLRSILSSPVPQTTTQSTTIGVNDTNATLSDDGPVILSEGDVDILILNLGGILNGVELYNETEGNNSSTLKVIHRVMPYFNFTDLREAASSEEDSHYTDMLEESKESSYKEPKGNLGGASKKPESTTKRGKLPTIIERKKRSNVDFFPLISKNNNPSTELAMTQHTTIGTSSKPLKRSINEENLKTETHKIDKDLSKSDPTMSKLINKRSDNHYQFGALQQSNPSSTTKSLLLAKDEKNSQTTFKTHLDAIPTFQSYTSGLTNIKHLTSNQQPRKTTP